MSSMLKYYGPEVVRDEEISYEWARIPHFLLQLLHVYQHNCHSQPVSGIV